MTVTLNGVDITDHVLPTCWDCERCTWNQGPDCKRSDHPHCPICGHCQYRHEYAPTPSDSPR